MKNICCGKIFRLSIIVTLFPALGAFGQKSYTLSGLTDSALHNLPLLLEKKAGVSRSRSEVSDLRHQFFPLLRANAQVDLGTDNSLPGSYYTFAIIPSTSAGISSQNNGQSALGTLGALYGEYTLLDFGYRKARIQSAISNTDLASADYERVRYQVKAGVARLYFAYLKNEMQQQVEIQNRGRYEKIFSVIQALAKSGVRPGSDSSLARAELSKSITAYNQARGSLNEIGEQLSYYTGIPEDQLKMDTGSLRNQDRIRNIILDSAMGMANPLIDYFTNINKVYESEEKLVAKSFQPTVSLIATGWTRGSSITPEDEYKSLSTGLSVQRYNYLAGISIQYDLFSGLHRKDRLQTIHFQQEAGKYEFQQEALELKSAENQADWAIQTAESNLQELPIQIQSANDVYNQKIAQYKAGVITLIDLTNAAFVLYRSLNDYTETITDWYLAHLDKAVAMGNLDVFIQTIK
jgi:outer membrane protein TolC